MENGKREVLAEILLAGAQPGGVTHSKQHAELLVACVEDVEKALLGLDASIKAASAQSDRLGLRIVWLNVVLAIATAVGAVATFWQVFR